MFEGLSAQERGKPYMHLYFAHLSGLLNAHLNYLRGNVTTNRLAVLSIKNSQLEQHLEVRF